MKCLGRGLGYFFHTRECKYVCWLSPNKPLTILWAFSILFYFYLNSHFYFWFQKTSSMNHKMFLFFFSHVFIHLIKKLIPDNKKKIGVIENQKKMSNSMQFQLSTTILRIFRFCIICGDFFVLLKSVEEEKLFKGLSLLGINSLCNSEDFMIYSLFRYYLDFFCLSYLWISFSYIIFVWLIS